MNRRVAIGSMFVTVLSLGSVESVAAQAVTSHAQEFNAPLAFTVTNPCTAEPVVLDGNIDLLIQTTAPPDDGLIIKTHVATTGRGFGTLNEVNYSFGEESDNEVHLLTRPDNVTLTNKQAVHLASAGRDDNFILLILVHTTINGNEMGATVENITCRCAGPEPGPEVKCIAPVVLPQ